LIPVLRVAAAQFPVSADVARNARYIREHISRASACGARVVHFPETALSGYGPSHVPEPGAYPWQRLEAHLNRIRDAAASAGLWVVLGTVRRMESGLPANSTLVIAPDGATVASYDKQRLYGDEKRHYVRGHSPTVVVVDGHRCGLLICYDNCYPELYEDYRRAGVGLLFLSLYNAGRVRATCLNDLMRANLIVRAADHGLWISASNSSQRHSPLPASIVRPDGSMVQAKRHVSGLVVDDYPAAELGWTYDNRRY
jgi:predicted amidohydrolase